MLVRRTLGPGDVESLAGFLESHRFSSMFLASNSRAAPLGSRGNRYAGTYAGAFEGGRLRGVVAHYEMGNLVLCAPEGDDAARLSVLALRRSGRPYAGVVGPQAEVDAGLVAIGAEAAPCRCDERELLMQVGLPQLVEPELASSPDVLGRRMQSADVPELANWAADYHVEAIGHERTAALRQRVERGLLEQLGSDETWVLEVEGQLRSMSRFNAELPSAVQLGGVWTPHAWRSRGYARAVVASHLSAVRAKGVQDAVLLTGETNLPARRVYEALGFEPVGRFRVAVLCSPRRLGSGSGWI